MKLTSIARIILNEAPIKSPLQLIRAAISKLGKSANSVEDALLKAIKNEEGNIRPNLTLDDIRDIDSDLVNRAVKRAEFKVYKPLVASKLYGGVKKSKIDDVVGRLERKEITQSQSVAELNALGIPPVLQKEVREISKKAVGNVPTPKPTSTPKPSSTTTTTPISTLSRDEQIKIVEPIIDKELALYKVAIPRNFKVLFMDEVIKLSEKMIQDAMPKIEGKGEKFAEWFNKLTINEKSKIFKEVQDETIKLKNANTNFVTKFWEYLTFFKDRKGTFIDKQDYKKAYQYAMMASAVSIVMDGLRAYYNSKHNQEFQGRFFDVFGEKGNWVAYGAKAASYLYAPAALVTNTVIALDSVFEYFVNVLFRKDNTKKEEGKSGVFDDQDVKNNQDNKGVLDGIKDN